ncbi:Ig-like domain-containing protein [Myxococcota bacterium]|nr:Ig-like domain-containing protein [Myxococcota bacterium]MBU1432840.1 Ig-like domain-containing protein [Myxococcota bacterium]MBU1897524.1 Ig-like domain-containing protein [Myxococcota bacterium]
MIRALLVPLLLIGVAQAAPNDIRQLRSLADLFAPPDAARLTKVTRRAKPSSGLTVLVTRPDGRPVGAGVPVHLAAANGAQEAQTDAEGRAHFKSTPIGQATIIAQYQGITFPFSLGVAPKGEEVEITVQENLTNLDGLTLENALTQLSLDEEGLVVRQEWRLSSADTFNPAMLSQGALILPGPPNAKHFGLSEELSGVKAIDGALHLTRPLLPEAPLTLRTWAIIAYDAETLEWRQAMPVAVRGATIVTPKGEKAHKRFPLALKTRGALGDFDERDDHWQVLMIKSTLKAGEPLVFAVSGLPSGAPIGAMVALGVAALGALALLLGFRRDVPPAVAPRAALEIERDRLLDALLRMERAFKVGRIKEVHFIKERDALITRLIALYEALG